MYIEEGDRQGERWGRETLRYGESLGKKRERERDKDTGEC